MINYQQKRYRRKKLAGQISKLFWTVLCLAGTIALLWFVVVRFIPWLQLLNETV